MGPLPLSDDTTAEAMRADGDIPWNKRPSHDLGEEDAWVRATRAGTVSWADAHYHARRTTACGLQSISSSDTYILTCSP